jgi:AraC-like DNA-binding protein
MLPHLIIPRAKVEKRMEIVRAAGIAGYDTVAAALGGNSLSSHRLTSYSHDASDPNDRCFLYSDVMDLLESSADRMNCADFGLRVAGLQNLEALGALGVAMKNAPTLRDAYAVAERYAHYQSPAIRFGLRPLPDPRFELLFFEIAMPQADPTERKQTYELSLSLTHNVLQQLSEGLCHPKEIWFQHEPQSPLSRYRSAFGIAPSFGREACGIVIARTDLARELAHSDRMVQRLAEHYLSGFCPAASPSMSEQVSKVIDMLLREQDCRQSEVAVALGIQPRTLQRRLADEGSSFEIIRDQVRHAQARAMLQSGNLSISQISERLRYAEPSAFTRSCQRWFGQSPRAYRRAVTQN